MTCKSETFWVPFSEWMAYSPSQRTLLCDQIAAAGQRLGLDLTSPEAQQAMVQGDYETHQEEMDEGHLTWGGR